MTLLFLLPLSFGFLWFQFICCVWFRAVVSSCFQLKSCDRPIFRGKRQTSNYLKITMSFSTPPRPSTQLQMNNNLSQFLKIYLPAHQSGITQDASKHEQLQSSRIRIGLVQVNVKRKEARRCCLATNGTSTHENCTNNYYISHQRCLNTHTSTAVMQKAASRGSYINSSCMKLWDCNITVFRTSFTQTFVWVYALCIDCF